MPDKRQNAKFIAKYLALNVGAPAPARINCTQIAGGNSLSDALTPSCSRLKSNQVQTNSDLVVSNDIWMCTCMDMIQNWLEHGVDGPEGDGKEL